MRSSSRSTAIGAAREEDLRSQPRANGGVPIASSNKPRAPVVRRQRLDGNQSEAVGNSRLSSTTQAKIASSRSSSQYGQAKPVPRGSSSFMGSSRNPAPVKKEDPKPIVYINKPNVPSRIPSTRDPTGINPASRSLNGTVSKVLGNSNRKDHGGVITKTSKASIVDDQSGGGGLDSVGTVTRVLSTSNRSSNVTKMNQPPSMANKISTNRAPQRREDDSGNVDDEQQHTGPLPSSNRKENKQAHSASGNIIASQKVEPANTLDL